MAYVDVVRRVSVRRLARLRELKVIIGDGSTTCTQYTCVTWPKH